MGALEDMGSGWPPYRISKTTLNAVTRALHQQAAATLDADGPCGRFLRDGKVIPW